MTQPLIEVQELCVEYGDRRILDGVSFAVQPREIFVVIGGSGCGKSTLVKAMTGLLRPRAGAVRFEGIDLTAADEELLASRQRRFGIAFQAGALFNSMTVGENVALALREHGGIDDTLIRALVRLKLNLVGLAAAETLMPDQLSGGMRKRAGLARAMALDPPVVFFDEPSAGLDPIMGAGLDELILNLRRLLGITFVIVTHELDSIRQIADRVMMLDRGKVLFLGTLAEALASASPRVRQFFAREADAVITQRNL